MTAFNREIERIEREQPDLSKIQPPKMEFKVLKKGIETRRGREGFEGQITRMFNYIRLGGDRIVTGSKGLTITVFEANEVKKEVSALNRKLTIEAKKAGISAEKGTSQMLEQQNLRHKKFSIDKTEKEFEKFKAGIEKRLMDKDREKKLKAYLQDYKDAVVKFLGEDGDELLEFLGSRVQDLEKFFLNSLGDPLLTIGFISDPLQTQLIAEKALNKWKVIFK